MDVDFREPISIEVGHPGVGDGAICVRFDDGILALEALRP